MFNYDDKNSIKLKFLEDNNTMMKIISLHRSCTTYISIIWVVLIIMAAPIGAQQLVLEQERPACFPGGERAMNNFIENNIFHTEETFPIVGQAIVKFEVSADGLLSNIHMIKGLDKILDQEIMRMIETMPNWTPAMRNGRPILSEFVLPITFVDFVANTDSLRGVEIENPSFPEGEKALLQFISNNLVYPSSLLVEDKEVDVYFTVKETGDIDNIEIQKGTDTLYINSVIKLLENMPKWSPAKYGGQAVSSPYVLTLLFKSKRMVRKY